MTKQHHLPKPSSQRWPRRHHSSQREFLYGTVTHYAVDILRDGLCPSRCSGGTYFTPAPYRALAYAKSWGLGVHAAGLVSKSIDIIFGLSVPPDTTGYVEQLHELRVDGGVSAHRIRQIDRLDFSDHIEVERAGHLFSSWAS